MHALIARRRTGTSIKHRELRPSCFPCPQESLAHDILRGTDTGHHGRGAGTIERVQHLHPAQDQSASGVHLLPRLVRND